MITILKYRKIIEFQIAFLEKMQFENYEFGSL